MPGIEKPFFRIARSQLNGSYDWEYMLDPRYASDRSMLCRAYHLIESDIKKLFEYIEPCDLNKTCFSHRTFELLLRTCTEVETNCKQILWANGYSKRDHLKMDLDYWKINR